MNKGVLREMSLQSKNDTEQIKQLEEFIKTSPGSNTSKFDNFSKYVQSAAISRFLARYEIFKQQLDIPGSIIDLGVARGASLMEWIQLSEIFEPVNHTREIIGFDTFEGFPKIDKKDMNPYSKNIKKGGFDVEEGMYEDIQKAIEIFNLNRHLNHIKKINVIKGDIIKTLPEYIDRNPHLIISLLHLDLDIYLLTKCALELLYERIPKGGIIIFDELNAKTYPGETVALFETVGIKFSKLKRFTWATAVSYAIID